MTADDAHRAEAKRLAALPADVRQQMLTAFRDAADDPELSAEEQAEARGRVGTLERLLQGEGVRSVTFDVPTNWTRNVGFTLAFCLSPCVSYGVYFNGNTMQGGYAMLAVYVRVSQCQSGHARARSRSCGHGRRRRRPPGSRSNGSGIGSPGRRWTARHGRSCGRVSCPGR